MNSLLEYLIALFIILLLLSGLLIRYWYASPQTSIGIQLLSTVAFALGFSSTVLLPVDLAIAEEVQFDNVQDNDDMNKDGDDANATMLPWHVIFWSTFLLAWFILPLAREMLLSGEFTIWTRFHDGIKKTMAGILIICAIGFCSIVWLEYYLKEFNVIPVLITLGNTYGLLLVSLLLGYGLVAFPRSLWRRAHSTHELNKAYLQAVELDDALYGAVWSLQDIEYDIDVAVSRIVDLDENERGDMHYRYCVNELLHRKNTTADLAPELHMRRTNNHGSGRDGRDGEDHDRYSENRGTMSDGRPTMKELVELNRKLKRAQENLFNADQKWNALREDYLFFSETSEVNFAFGTNKNNGASFSKSGNGSRRATNHDDSKEGHSNEMIKNPPIASMSMSLPPSPMSGKGTVTANANQSLLKVVDAKGTCAACNSKLKYAWKKYFRSIFFRIGAILGSLLSCAILWSEATLASKYNLSPFALVQEYLSSDDENTKMDGFWFQIAVLIPLLYMTICVSTGLFSVGRFGPYSLHGHRQSTGTALVFNTQYLVRLQFSLGYNYLMMLKYDTSDSAFSQFVGQMNVVPLFGKTFPVYAPLLIIFLCAFTLCNAYAKLMHLLGFDHSDALLVGDQETLESKINEGKNLLRQYDHDDSGGRSEGAFSFAETELTETKSSSRSIV